MAWSEELLAHLGSGATTLARAWAVERRDGVRLGFTDHDRDLAFDGWTFRADTGVTASTLQQTSGLAVDNSEAMGALSDAGLCEVDIAAGRFDGAAVCIWVVNWQRQEERAVIFRGTIGEIRRGAGAFHAELRGLAERLNLPLGRVYQKACSAVLGDAKCRVDLTSPGYSAELDIIEADGGRIFRLSASGQAPGWFERGRFRVLTGNAAGLAGLVKVDRAYDGTRVIELWQAIGADAAPGDRVRLEAGCDRRAETCRGKFMNFLNFRGFPSIPGEDWLVALPSRQVRR